MASLAFHTTALLAPHLCSAGHHSMTPGDSEVTGIEPGALLHGRIRGLCPLGQERKDGGKSSSCPMGAETFLAGLAGDDGSDAGPRGLRLALSLPPAPGQILELVFPRVPAVLPKEGRAERGGGRPEPRGGPSRDRPGRGRA